VDDPSFSSGRSETRADGLSGLRRRSVFLGSVLVVLLALTDGPWLLAGRSAWFLVDCPRHLDGLSVWALRTVRPTWPDSPPEPSSFVPWFDSSSHSFVLPRVLQVIVPKT
jgi:hypothetical protein